MRPYALTGQYCPDNQNTMITDRTTRWPMMVICTSILIACGGGADEAEQSTTASTANVTADGGQSTVVDDQS